MKDIRYNDPLQLGACVLLSSQELLPAQLEQLYNPHHLSETKVSHGKRQLGLPIRYVALARVGSVKPCRGNNSNTVHRHLNHEYDMVRQKPRCLVWNLCGKVVMA